MCTPKEYRGWIPKSCQFATTDTGILKIVSRVTKSSQESWGKLIYMISFHLARCVPLMIKISTNMPLAVLVLPLFLVLQLTAASSSWLLRTKRSFLRDRKFSTSSAGYRGRRSIPGETNNNTSKELATKHPTAPNWLIICEKQRSTNSPER